MRLLHSSFTKELDPGDWFLGGLLWACPIFCWTFQGPFLMTIFLGSFAPYSRPFCLFIYLLSGYSKLFCLGTQIFFFLIPFQALKGDLRGI